MFLCLFRYARFFNWRNGCILAMITSLILLTVLLSSSSFEQKFKGTLSLSEDQSKNMKMLPDLLNKIIQLQSDTTLSLSNLLNKTLEMQHNTTLLLSAKMNKTSTLLDKIVQKQQTNNPPQNHEQTVNTNQTGRNTNQGPGK